MVGTSGLWGWSSIEQPHDRIHLLRNGDAADKAVAVFGSEGFIVGHSHKDAVELNYAVYA